MQDSKRGDSHVVRLPNEVIEARDLKERDQIEIRGAGERRLAMTEAAEFAKALALVRRLRRPLPEGFRFNRVEAHER